jgi:hypothetical protein
VHRTEGAEGVLVDTNRIRGRGPGLRHADNLLGARGGVAVLARRNPRQDGRPLDASFGGGQYLHRVGEDVGSDLVSQAA